MHTHLTRILDHKKIEVEKLHQEVESHPTHPLRSLIQTMNDESLQTSSHAKGPFYHALKDPSGLSIISEIKRRSPSAGDIGQIRDPKAFAQKYQQGGASAFSVLTDHFAFGGSLDDLRSVGSLENRPPMLRKDFTLDALQLAEAAWAGGVGVLLIVAVLGDQIRMLSTQATRLGLDVLVEVHDQAELELALDAQSAIVGINNRNLHDFSVDLATAERLAPKLPSHVVKVAESGFRQPADAHRMRQAGFDALLVGEALVRADDPGLLIRQFRAEESA